MWLTTSKRERHLFAGGLVGDEVAFHDL